MPQPPQFVDRNDRRLRRLGLAGRQVTVTLGEREILLTGEAGSTARIAFASLTRARFGFVEGKSGTYPFVRLWLSGQDRPLELGGGYGRQPYYAFAHALAAALFAARPDLAIETGDGYFTPILVIGAFGAMALFCTGMTLLLLLSGSEDWTDFLGALAVSLALLIPLGWWSLSRYAPRRIRRADEVLRALPGYKPA
ncbi:hypothetical protein D3874_26325 [Oleomonas cavernae]|uniref:Uncharacterized protein n=1 Tax=Oleomonas cavernae TaxID=2320859 RepID=A0A418VU04_9PROT|nr:hypothetical protein [Oleomonas cavernae]RJF80627.1 hypothetical protein D3874_26325 [Oleomonas cavernae]